MTPMLKRLLPAATPVALVQPSSGLAVPPAQPGLSTQPIWPVAHRLPPLPAPVACDRAADADLADASGIEDGAAVDEPADDAAACGWFESSEDLQQGLTVQEWPQDHWPVAMLYFAQLQPSGARLQ